MIQGEIIVGRKNRHPIYYVWYASNDTFHCDSCWELPSDICVIAISRPKSVLSNGGRKLL
jgi:hypothetical protein